MKIDETITLIMDDREKEILEAMHFFRQSYYTRNQNGELKVMTDLEKNAHITPSLNDRLYDIYGEDIMDSYHEAMRKLCSTN